MLVTGGAGFIGSHLVERLLRENHEVICLDNFDPYYDSKIKHKNIIPFQSNGNFTLIEGDILDQYLLQNVLDGVDYIFHEAAQAGVRASVENPMKAHQVNATGTLKLLEAAMDTNVKKIVYASSSSVYGQIKYLPFDEDHPNTPISPYGISKLMAEEYCRVFNEIYGLNTISLRYFTVYGPRMRPDLAISIFTKKALKDEPIEIFGDGTKTRDFTYIDDVVKANLLATKKGKGTYNIGSGRSISILELAEQIIRHAESDSRIIYGKDAKGDAEHTLAKVEKAKSCLGWVADVDINLGIKKYVDWQKGNILMGIDAL